MILARAKYDVLTDCICAGVDSVGGSRGERAGVDTHATEVATEVMFHRLACSPFQRFSAGS